MCCKRVYEALLLLSVFLLIPLSISAYIPFLTSCQSPLTLLSSSPPGPRCVVKCVVRCVQTLLWWESLPQQTAVLGSQVGRWWSLSALTRPGVMFTRGTCQSLPAGDTVLYAACYFTTKPVNFRTAWGQATAIRAWGEYTVNEYKNSVVFFQMDILRESKQLSTRVNIYLHFFFILTSPPKHVYYLWKRKCWCVYSIWSFFLKHNHKMSSVQHL